MFATLGGLSGCAEDPADLSGASASASSSGGTTEGSTEPTTGDGVTGFTITGPTSTEDPTSSTAPTSGSDSITGSGETSESTTTGGSDSTGGGPNSLPVALEDHYIGKSRQPLSVNAALGVLSNDYDPDGDIVTVIASDPLTPGGASLTMPKEGSFNYLPPADLWGSDSFTYKIWDGVDGFASAKVHVELNPTSIPLAAVAAGKGGFVIDGAAPDDYSSRAVQRLGDINQDGHQDLVVSAHNAANNAGRIYVVFGKSAGGPISLADLEDKENGFEITGEVMGDTAGRSISGPGDVNGDGLPDILIGAPKSAVNGKSSGTSYVVFGKLDSTPVFLELVAVGQGGFSIEGEAAQQFSGQSLRGAGDVNGDGLADLVIGALGASPNGPFSGRAYVVFGRGAGKPVHLLDIAAGTGPGFVMNGAVELDFAGSAVAGAGDVNGDGLADVVIGAYGADINGDTSGRSYVVFGKPSQSAIELAQVAVGIGGFAIDGELEFDQAGASVAGAGDVNGDGLADVFIGAPLADPSGKNSGRAYVVFGKPDTKLVKLVDVVAGSGGFAMNGQQSRDYAGFSLDGVGDVNGDGLSDVIVGAYGANPAGNASGRSYVVYGKQSTDLVNLTAVANGGDGGFALDGELEEDYSGFSVAGAGDVDGDGFADVIVGAFANDAKGASAGRGYVVLGGDYSNLARKVGGLGPDNLAGTAAAELFIGGRGDDVISGQGGADIIYSGAGKDTIRLLDLAYRRIDAGEGEDTVLLMGAGLKLDLSQRLPGDLSGVEIFDLADGDHTLLMTRRELLALTPVSHVLTVKGSKGSVEADLAGTGFVDKGVVDGYHLFSDEITTLRVAVGLLMNITL
ncbi:MAG: FG-GAP repeat protein [Nannocystis sp.]|nr:Ig-like domain-containing protein [Nannocystis sp.]MBA3547431.1 FG-GAP repeat protein [Nannocystis sp.]